MGGSFIKSLHYSSNSSLLDETTQLETLSTSGVWMHTRRGLRALSDVHESTRQDLSGGAVGGAEERRAGELDEWRPRAGAWRMSDFCAISADFRVSLFGDW